jgi:RimJ/RimL family protein N-acetyltransferase
MAIIIRAKVDRRPAASPGMDYHNVDPWNRWLASGWIAAPAFWHQRLMREAAEVMLSHYVLAMDMHRVEALTEPGRHRYHGLAVKLGFKQESDPLRDRRLPPERPTRVSFFKPPAFSRPSSSSSLCRPCCAPR